MINIIILIAAAESRITMKYMLLICLATNVLMGMDRSIQYHPSGHYYAQIEKPYLFKGQFIKKVAYPVVIKQLSDNKVLSQFNFDSSIKQAMWVDCTLCVILHNGEKHGFSLNYLQLDSLYKNDNLFRQ